MLKSMRHFYFTQYKKFWVSQKYEEDWLPGIEFIEKLNKESWLDK